ncbi:MAG: hypothetical protein ACTHL8_18925 [Burkholderiaceae bacterium]
MATDFEFRVVALDRFTKTFRDLNSQASRAARPLVNTHRQVAMLAKEMHLDTMAKGMGTVSSAALTMTRSIGLSLGPLESVLGIAGGIGTVGIVGALGSAAAGMAKMGVNFATSGFEIKRTAKTIGVSTRDLQYFRGAARMAGLDVDTMTDSLASLGTTLQDAKFNRNPAAYAVLNRLGIGIPTKKNGEVDQVAAIKGVARAMSTITDAQTRLKLAQALGLSPAAVYQLSQGADALEKYAAELERVGYVRSEHSLQVSEDFAKALGRIGVNAEGAANKLEDRLLPAMTRVLDKVADATEKGGLSGGLLTFIGEGMKKIPGIGPLGFPAHQAGRFWSWLGSTSGTTANDRKVGGAIGGVLHAGAYVPGEAASGVAAGAAVPRNNPGNLRSWPGVPSVGGFAQFPNPQAGLQAMAAQLGLYGARGNDTVAGIVGQWAPPSDHNDTAAYIADVAKRTGFAPGQHLNLGDPSVLPPLMAAMVNHEQGGQPFSGQQYADAAAGAQKVAIDVHVHGLPPGATVTAQQRLAAADAFTPTRIGYSMPAGSMP